VYYKAHGGGHRCQNLGCTKNAKGKTNYYIVEVGVVARKVVTRLQEVN